MAEQWDRERFEREVGEQYGGGTASVMRLVDRWIARGDGAAVYRNEDLGSIDVGLFKITSYGSPQAQIETPEPPVQMPDIGNQVNWRYQLYATYREEKER